MPVIEFVALVIALPVLVMAWAEIRFLQVEVMELQRLARRAMAVIGELT